MGTHRQLAKIVALQSGTWLNLSLNSECVNSSVRTIYYEPFAGKYFFYMEKFDFIFDSSCKFVYYTSSFKLDYRVYVLEAPVNFLKPDSSSFELDYRIYVLEARVNFLKPGSRQGLVAGQLFLFGNR